MARFIRWRGVCAAFAAALLLSDCGARPPAKVPRISVEFELTEAQRQWQETLRARRVDEVAPGIFVAVGFGLATATMIVGPEGRIIVDTMETPAAARDVKAAFDAIDASPIRAVIYTHGHPDHTGGTAVFVEGDTPVYAHANYTRLTEDQNTAAGASYRERAMRQFGLLLPDDAPARFLRIDIAHLSPPFHPTHFIDNDRHVVEAAGRSVELILAPGETIDTMAVWLEAERVLLAGDDVYPSFPNLYTLRGEPSRNVLQWAGALDTLRDLDAAVLVSGHGPPLIGAETIRETLTAYGDAIQFVHDQTLKAASEGMGLEDIVAGIALPPHLARHPWLQEVYGRVDWSVRAIYQGYFGFFDGDAANLHPLPPAGRAARLARLAGGEEALRQAARAALEEKDFQWAVELSQSLRQLPGNEALVKEIRGAAFDALALQETSVNGINYYLTQAAEARGEVLVRDPLRQLSPEFVASLPLTTIFRTLPCRLNAAAALETDTAAAFRFPDTGEAWTVHVRRGVAEIRPGVPAEPDLSIEMDAQVFKEMLLGVRNPALALLLHASIDGGIRKAGAFLSLFRSDA